MPELVIEGQRFPCRESLPPWRLMELASAMRSKNVMAQLGGMHDFVIAVIQPEYQGDFMDAMRAMDDDPDVVTKLNESIGTLMAEYSSRPTERPSQLPAGQSPTGQPSRVVSLSRGTVMEVPESSMDGASTGS